jgi:hypothetical protein
MLDIVIEEVIGWDLKERHPRTDIVGLFGIPKAFTASVEEQGRKTLHSHIQIWIERFDKLRSDLHAENRIIRRIAEQELCKAMDQVGGCSLLSFDEEVSNHRVCAVFPHECSVRSTQRGRPVVVDDQKLRDLRHREGHTASGGTLAHCPNCAMSWTSTELVEAYLMNKTKVAGLTTYPDNETRCLKAMAVEYQKGGADASLSSSIIDAACNLHCHTSSSCFGKAETLAQNNNRPRKKKRKSGRNYECRYRYPQRKKRKTVVQNASDNPVEWFSWDGSWEDRFIK